MSRCFPFPPPGYEKEASTCDLDLLKKEKDERKKKKEKKNREKKDGTEKEKKEKDRSEGKHRVKKEKKTKHRDKEKDRNKDKDKSTLDDNQPPKQVEHFCVDEASDEKRLGFPIRSEVNAGDLFSHKGKEREFDCNSLSGDQKTSRQFSGYSQRACQNSHSTELPKDSKLLQQADSGIRDEARGASKLAVERFTGADARKNEGMVVLAAKSTGTSSDGMEKIKATEGRKSSDHGVRNGLKFIGSVTSQSSTGIVQPGIDSSLKPLEKDSDKRIDGKEKSKKKERDDREGDKKKEKEVREKEKGRDKEKKEEEKVKQKSLESKIEPDKLKKFGKNDIISGIYNAKTSQIPKESIKNPVTEANLKKRKDLDTNGFLSGNGIKPSKVAKPSSPHPPTQNGKVSGTPSPLLLGRQGTVNKLQTDGKERRINCIIESPASTVSLTTLPPPVVTPTTMPPSIPTKLATAKVDPATESSRKLPHPDSKYLSEVLTVPKMEEWSDYDDQVWLFQISDSQSKKTRAGTFKLDAIPQVWSEALRIESADVCALPYVIPY